MCTQNIKNAHDNSIKFDDHCLFEVQMTACSKVNKMFMVTT